MSSSRSLFPLAKEYKIERDVLIDSSRIINMHAIPAINTTQQTAWVPVSGFENGISVGTGPARAAFVFRGSIYWVSGTDIFEIDSTLVPVLRGTIGTATGYVGITANQTQVMFVDGDKGYIWDTASSVFSTIVFGFPILPSDVAMLDNYFITFEAGQQKFYVSALGDGTTWSALNFAVFESNPDQLLAIKALKRRLFLFGQFSTETWYDAGATDFPLRRDNNSLFEHGVYSAAAVNEGFEIMMYLAQNQNGCAGVMLVLGTALPQKVSTPAIDLLLQGLTDLTDSDSILYKENGFTFYQLSFVTDNLTLVYVVETNLWHQIELIDGSRSPISVHAYLNSTHYVGTFNSNQLYELSYKFFTFDGDLIRMILDSPPFYSPQHKRIRVDRFELEVNTGMPEVTLPVQYRYDYLNEFIQQNGDPSVILFISRDGGRTYGNGHRVSIGKLGDYTLPVRWRKLGVHRERRVVIRLEFPYKLPLIIIGAYIVFEELPE